MDKPKVHVFVGAPHPSSVSEEAPEGKSYQWKTVELHWSRGRLSTRAEVSEHDGVTTSKDQGGMSIDGGLKPTTINESLNVSSSFKGNKTENVSENDSTPSIGQSSGKMTDGLNPATHHEKYSFSSSYETSNASEDALTPLICQSSKQEHAEKEDLVTEYLDSCFPSPQAGSSIDHSTTRPQPNLAMSVETEYLTVWTKSQGLLLRGNISEQPEAGSPRSPQTTLKQTPLASLGSPDLYSPEVSPGKRGMGGTLQGSFEILYGNLSQRHQEGGLFLECISDGFLCSQASLPDHAEVAVEQGNPGLLVSSQNPPIETSPTPSTSKRAKLSPAATKDQPHMGQKRMIPLHGPTTLLSRCSTHGVNYSILVAVVHPCHLKEIKVKSGASAGSCVPMASVIVTDQSGVEMKVVLWRTAAFWALTVYPGDVLLITGEMYLTFDKI